MHRGDQQPWSELVLDCRLGRDCVERPPTYRAHQALCARVLEPGRPWPGASPGGDDPVGRRTLFLEDCAAIADLAAGAACEFISSLVTFSSLPVRGIVNRLPRTITPKTQRLAFWLAAPSPSLRKLIVVLDDPKRSGGGRATQLNLMPIFDVIERAGSIGERRPTRR